MQLISKRLILIIMIKGLVSILTPAYNAASHIRWLLDSVLMQDYSSIEMIIIDDGSSDNTMDIVESYIDMFSSRGYLLQCFSQPNGGQSSAINYGLKKVRGEYLVWPDSDDYYATTEAISKMVSALANSGADVSVVRCLNIHVDEHNRKEIYRIPIADDLDRTDLWMDCLRGEHGFWFQPGDYMCKMGVLDKVIPNREIYTERLAGQNWQILLPLFCKYRCITIKEYLYYIVERNNSHSRTINNDFEKSMEKEKSYGNTILQTIQRIPQLTEAERYHYLRLKRCDAFLCYMNLSIRFKQPADAIKYMNCLIQEDYPVTLWQKISAYFCDSFFSPYLDAIKCKLMRR